jgi:hypothetical protein
VKKGLGAEDIMAMCEAQIHLAPAAEALGAEPPPRALDCGAPRVRGDPTPPPAQAVVYDPVSQLYVLFGGTTLGCSIRVARGGISVTPTVHPHREQITVSKRLVTARFG